MRKKLRETFFDTRDIGPRNERFVTEVARYGLRYRCEHCIHVALPAVSCTLGYPNEDLTGDQHLAVGANGRLSFCKDFEMGEQG